MALSRRTGQRFQAAIWPGFVDAMTGLLLVLMFVLTIFMVVQFVLRETISGQESELDALAGEVAALADALGLEERRVSELSTTLESARDEVAEQQSLIATLTAQRDAQADALTQAQTRITSFEAQVAALAAQRDGALGQVADLEQEQVRLMSEQEALNLALAQARTEINSQTEEARLAAARTEALEALVAELRSENADSAAATAVLQEDLDKTQEALSEEEAARLADAAAAEALRQRLQNADTELTAMTLALEEQRRDAEETLTLLAAARAGQEDLDAAQSRLAEAATQIQERETLLALARQQLSEEEDISAEARREAELLNQQVAALRTQLNQLQGLLDEANTRDEEREVQLQSLGSELNTALARVAAEERRRRQLEEAERTRLEAERDRLADESQNLARYRSEFFGRLRDVLGNQEGVRIEGDRFVFSSEVLFAPGDARLSGAGQTEVAKVARILRSVANEIPPEIDWVIRVDGHTDNVPLRGSGQFRDNWELSQGRALSVVRYMIEALGIPPDRLAANGFGQFQPVNLADTPAARAQNRRIELKFTEK
ncbi:MAG: peptidoglycan -binding protein [Pseudomonadota bacterium]